MEDKNIEMMKKIIEAKKVKSNNQGGGERPEKAIGGSRKAARSSRKSGGVFDK